MQYEDIVRLERVARELKRLIGYGAKPQHLVIQPTLRETVLARHPNVDTRDLGALILHYLKEAVSTLPDSAQAKAATYLLNLDKTSLSALDRRLEAIIVLHEYCSEQTWRKSRELEFMRQVAQAFISTVERREAA